MVENFRTVRPIHSAMGFVTVGAVEVTVIVKKSQFLHKERPTEKSDFLVYWTRTNHIDYFKLHIG
jgi:hypothetical protein